MFELGTLTIIGVIVLALLVWFLVRAMGKDHLDGLQKMRTGNCHITGRAQFVQGMEGMPVVIALDERVFYYENADMQAQFDVSDIEEIEYDDELATGKSVSNGEVMRLRAHNRMFEFIVPKTEAGKWKSCLIPRHFGESPSGAAQAV